MDLISVIVPVYKVEAYLDRCVQSIVDQTYTNLEIILVDDGSPDRCPEMCEDWAERDSRIRVIHQKNAGAGAARNAGLASSGGSFIAFVDSDDYLSPHMYTHLMSLVDPETDIVECDFISTEATDYKFSPPSQDDVQSVSAAEAMSLHISDRIFRQTIWNKLYRREVVESVLFPVGKLIDDEFWTFRVLGKARRLKHSSCKLYAYLQQPDSVMHIAYSLRRLQATEAKEYRMNYMREHFPSLLSQAAVSLWVTCLYQGQMSLRYLTAEDQAKAFRKLLPVVHSIPLRNFFASEITFVYRMWFLLTKISFKLTCKLRNFLKIGL